MHGKDEKVNTMQAGSECSAGLGAGIGEAINQIVLTARNRLFALTETEIANEWFWRWEEGLSVEWNTYTFSDSLETHKRRCRQWEEHHNGSCCVVERVRDKYLMPKVRGFLSELHMRSA